MHDVLIPKHINVFLKGGLIVSSGENEFHEAQRVLAPFKRGLTAAITLEGCMSCRVDDRAPIPVEAPSVSLIVCASDHRREQIFAPRQTFRYVLVHLSIEVAESHLGIPFERMVARAVERCGGHEPAFITAAADASVRSIASQIMICPIQGVSRDLFLLGKALELTACAIEGCLPSVTLPEIADGLSADDLKRVTMARDILVERFAESLAVTRLSGMVGLSTKALAVGFRRLFGMGIPEFLQEYRLQLAYSMLAAGETGVAETAYRVGYTPAYFSTLFRNRFGISPRDLR